MIALVVDDHPLARRGLSVILWERLAVEEVWEADGAEGALILAARHAPDLVLLDMRIPDSLPAPELCARLRTIVPRAAIVMVTAFRRAQEIRECLVAGADGCVLKETSEADLEAALRDIAAGRTVIDPRTAQELAADAISGARGRPGLLLTSRERDVLSLLAEGCSNRAIAGRLLLSETTVKGYVSSLLAKLGASSRLEAVVRASEEGLLPEGPVLLGVGHGRD